MLRCRLSFNFVRNEFLTSRRRFSAAAKQRAKHETIQVPCQSNGSISLDIHKPLSHNVAPGANGAVLLYLPRRPTSGDSADDAANISVLQSTVNAHVVKINYRANDNSQFPTPIHDVLAGYDWVVSNLLAKRAITRPGRSDYVGRLAVCGELLGGGLATTLALTECRIGEPGIIAAAVNNPITNWIELGDQHINASTAIQEQELSDLMKLRDTLFRKPELFYDPFASPILFFRSAGVDVPEHIERKMNDEMEELSQLERMEYLREHGIFADVANPESLENAMLTTKTRKATRRYPSKTLGLRLPSFHVSSGSGSVLSNSTTELVHQLRKSFDRQIDSGVLRNATSLSEPPCTDAMLRHEHNDGQGSWDATKSGRERMQKVADWLARKMAT